MEILHNVIIKPSNLHFQRGELKPNILTSFDILCNLMDDNLTWGIKCQMLNQLCKRRHKNSLNLATDNKMIGDQVRGSDLDTWNTLRKPETASRKISGNTTFFISINFLELGAVIGHWALTLNRCLFEFDKDIMKKKIGIKRK